MWDIPQEEDELSRGLSEKPRELKEKPTGESRHARFLNEFALVQNKCTHVLREDTREEDEFPRELNEYTREEDEFPRELNEYTRELNEYPQELNEYPHVPGEYTRELNEYTQELNEYPHVPGEHTREEDEFPRELNEYTREEDEYTQELNESAHVPGEYTQELNEYPHVPGEYTREQDLFPRQLDGNPRAVEASPPQEGEPPRCCPREPRLLLGCAPLAMTTQDPLRRTPLFDCHVRAGARIVPFAGWEMPVQYAGLVAEHQAVRTAAGMFDVSHMGRLQLKGARAGQVANHLITNDASKLVDGQACYTAACNERGTILDDLIVYRLKAEHFIIVCNASNLAKMSPIVAAAARGQCDFEDMSARTSLIAIQGPKAYAIMTSAGGDAATLSALGSFHLREATIRNIRCIVARTGYTGEDGAEIFCDNADAPALWDLLLELGRPFGVAPAGLGARDTLRLEARLSLYGHEIDETTNPLEAGIGWAVKLDKPGFVGREALLAVKAKGLTRKIVGFEMTGRGIARNGYPLQDSPARWSASARAAAPARPSARTSASATCRPR